MRAFSRSLAVLAILSACLTIAAAAEPFCYPEAKHGQGELRYINHIPVMILSGTPEEIGEQMGTLAKPALKNAEHLLDGYIEAKGMTKLFPALLKTAGTLRATFPPDYLKEMEAISKASGMNLDLIIAGHALPDMLKLRGCSDIVIEPAKSSSGKLIFGRNTDVPPVEGLPEYSLIVVYRPKGKHSFAAVSFPGAVGFGAAMNDAGLCLGQNEILSSADNAVRYNPLGLPIALAARRIVEECKDVDEAEKLIRQISWTTANLFMIADRKEGRVFEITPKNVRVIKSNEAFCAATNYFRTPELATTDKCWRMDILKALAGTEKMGVSDVEHALDDVNQGAYTIHSQIFEPSSLRGHFAFGKGPATKLPYREIELAHLLRQNN